MRVCNSADRWERLVQSGMRRKIRGWAKTSFDHLALHVRYNQIRQFHLVIRDTARLDDDQTFLSRNSAGITEGRTEIQCFPFFDEGAARDASVVGADAASVRKESAGTTRTNPIIPASSCSNR